MKRPLEFFLVVSALAGISSCASLTLEQVDFAWPVESVLVVSNTNAIEEGRYAVAFNVSKLAMEEFQDSTALRGATLRMLRNSEGFYFVTGAKFRHAYVFAPGPHELSMKSKIEVTKYVLRNPALNQRTPYVELVDGDAYKVLLTSDDMVEGKKP